MNTNITNWKDYFDNHFIDWNSPRYFSEGTTTDKIKDFISNLLKEQEKQLKPKRTITFTSKNFDFTPVSNPLDLETYENP